jgi:hypothetical protein
MSYNYSQFVNAIQTLLVANDAQGAENLSNWMPNIIDYAEQRIYRELDLLTSLTRLTSTASGGTQTLSVSQQVIVLKSVNCITPIGATPSTGLRNPLRRVTPEYIAFAYPDSTYTFLPECYSLLNDNATNSTFSQSGATQTLMMAPVPDQNYTIEFVGTIRPTPLSSSNPYTFLTMYLPDLFLAAAMVSAAGYQRDYGAAGMVDDVGLGITWEKQYELLKQSANIEELRRKSQSANATAITPSPLE